MSAQSRWDAHVVGKLDEVTERLESLDIQIEKITERLAGLSDSVHPSVVAVRSTLTLDKTRLERRRTRQTSLKSALENRMYAVLSAEHQGYVDFIADNTPDGVLRIGAQSNIDLEQYYNEGLAASASITDVAAITEQDFVDIAAQIGQGLYGQ